MHINTSDTQFAKCGCWCEEKCTSWVCSRVTAMALIDLLQLIILNSLGLPSLQLSLFLFLVLYDYNSIPSSPALSLELFPLAILSYIVVQVMTCYPLGTLSINRYVCCKCFQGSDMLYLWTANQMQSTPLAF